MTQAFGSGYGLSVRQTIGIHPDPFPEWVCRELFGDSDSGDWAAGRVSLLGSSGGTSNTNPDSYHQLPPSSCLLSFFSTAWRSIVK